MPRTQATFTPQEILQAGYAAEGEGRVEHARQFYRHLTDYYARTQEGSEAYQALQRLDTQSAAPPAAARSLSTALNGHRIEPSDPAPVAFPETRPAAVRQAAAQEQPMRDAATWQRPPARAFIVGRILAGLLLVVAALSLLAGLVLLGFGLLNGLDRPSPAGISAAAAAPTLIITGIVLGLVGQLCQAAFRTANAATDIASALRDQIQRGDEHR